MIEKKVKYKGPMTRPKLTDETRELMMLCLIRLPAVYSQVHSVLESEHFDEYRDYGLIWTLLADHYAKSAQAPKEIILLSAARDAMQDQPQQDALGLNSNNILGTIRKAYRLPILDTDVVEYGDFGAATVAQFIEEQLFEEAAGLVDSSRSVPHPDRSVLADLAGRMARVCELRQPVGVADDVLWPDGLEFRGKVKRATGCSFFDHRFLDGGAAVGEAHGILGGYGSCKTTLANQLVANAAMSEQERAYRTGYDGKKKIAFLFYWEAADEREFLHRALSYVAEIPLKRLHNMKSWDDLSHSGNLQEYEKSMYAAELRRGRPIRGERERAKLFRPVLNEYASYCDMSGATGDYKLRGSNGPDEIVNLIGAKLKQRKADGVSMVAFDYMGALVSRYMGARGLPQDRFYRHYISEFVLELKTKVARAFGCDIWILHQLRAEANSRAPGGSVKMTDAAESKSFAEHLDFCFPIGLPLANGLCVLSCDKHRRVEQLTPEIVQINGGLCRVVSTSGTHTLDPVAGRIVEKRDLKMSTPEPEVVKKKRKHTMVIGDDE